MKTNKTWAVFTHKGNKRKMNQDAYIVRKYEVDDLKLHFCAVADGVGGHGDGHRASQLVVKELANEWSLLLKASAVKKIVISQWYEKLCQAIQRSNSKLYAEYKSGGVLHATTCSFCIMNESEIFIAHVGDSRIFSVFKRVICLTRDHSIEGKTILTNCIGANEYLVFDSLNKPLVRGEKILLATDGFYRLFEESSYQCIAKMNAQMSVDYLITLAMSMFRKDDLTVIVCHL